MSAFAQKQNQPRRKSSTTLTRSNRLEPAASHKATEVLTESPTTTRFAHDFSRIPVHAPAPRQIQTKLSVNTPGDIYEQEADHLAEHVMRMPEPKLQGARAKCQTEQTRQEHPRLQTKHVGPSGAGQIAAPPIVDKVLASVGQPLDTSTRAFFEPRFGHDFGHVRVHTDVTAAQSAAAVHARAYTVGRDLVFAGGQYAPNTANGQRLLAHELAHVSQQESSIGANVVQRAEVDDRSCAGLKDIESDIDAQVNKELSAERAAMKTASPGAAIFAPLFLIHVWQRLGQGAISPIEIFVESLAATKRNIPPDSLAGTKYSGVDAVNQFYKLQTKGMAHVVGSAAKIHGICVGADKLAHLFDQGFAYFNLAAKPGTTTADTENLGREMETGIFGLGATGVFSNADLAANRAGLQFYKDLEKNPGSFKFKIGNYITSQWNEQVNPNFYDSQVGSVVWSNLLTGPWKGSFTSSGITTPFKSFNLTATTSGSVTGTFELQAKASAGASKDIKIKNGKITQRTTSVSVSPASGPATTVTPVSGISIEFEWERDALSGKGKLDSVNEQTLEGTWGLGSATTGVATLKLTKV